MYNVCKYTVLQRKLQVLERTWFWSAQAACAYHFVGREWRRHTCGNRKHEFSALISFAFEIRHSSLSFGSELSFVCLRICTATSHQYRLGSESDPVLEMQVTVPGGFGNLVFLRTGVFVSILQVLCIDSSLVKNQTSLMDFWQDGSFT